MTDEGDGTAVAPPADETPEPRKGGFPKGTPRGVCKVCGAPARTASATTCEVHKNVRADRAPRPTGTLPPSQVSNLEDELRTQVEFWATMWAMKDPGCAAVLLPRDAKLRVVIGPPTEENGAPQLLEISGQGHAAAIAHFWAERAAVNPTVARVLGTAVGSSGWLGGIGVHAPIIMAVWMHHVQPAIEARRQVPYATDDEIPGMPYGPRPAANGEDQHAHGVEPPPGWPADVPFPPEVAPPV